MLNFFSCLGLSDIHCHVLVSYICMMYAYMGSENSTFERSTIFCGREASHYSQEGCGIEIKDGISTPNE